MRKDPQPDEDHLKLYPNCGQLSQNARARISNAQRSEVTYPWAIQIVRRTQGIDEPLKCGATIITVK